MAKSKVDVLNEIRHPQHISGDFQLCLQWCRYHYEDGTHPLGFRFIWRRPNGNLAPARGQTRIPSLADAEDLIRLARAEDWGKGEGDIQQ
jgi:hypothetical protein